MLATQWGTQELAMCACGQLTQSVQHVVVDCVIHKAPDDFAGLCRLDSAKDLVEIKIDIYMTGKRLYIYI